MKTIYLAGGCFWCIEYFFLSLKGVISVTSGYSGGQEKEVTYEMVKNQLTGHRETIKVDYDENIISLEAILDEYFLRVDPLDEGGQFIDRGHSYTLAIYYENNDDYNIIVMKCKDIARRLAKKIYVSIEPFLFFIKAEEEHQGYCLRHPKAFQEEIDKSGRKL